MFKTTKSGKKCKFFIFQVYDFTVTFKLSLYLLLKVRTHTRSINMII